ncbi:nitroreductase family deazaflavin-dependent oxidoreductase [Naumannella cuiyingiana]|uniref:Deazaflavin-dependent oxidoreductase (Nitroreductase family) n=1 Tax=Naumannella cuiyingiana TaxID=1347891 RepID=A0A7Z0DC81_9ACTN|nr:nitroreductase family deazaflavin-dependent oxidoreductase [Naumannella cuiyingiana]NYI72624.1 deazaflavin-dependent oxidoreductase (nitroreductase family) [Naumannella cuiyingiana]
MGQWEWVRKQLADIDAAGDTAAASVKGMAVVVMNQQGAKTGELRRVPVMRVEADGNYAAVASKGGSPENPVWFNNLVAHPDIELMDGSDTFPVRARLVDDPEEYRTWWDRSVAAYPPYAEYQTKTDRKIPIFVLEPR